MQKETIKGMKVLVLASGGLDSISTALSLKNDYDVTLLTFQYGQKASKETEIVKLLSEKYQLPLVDYDITSLKEIFGKNQLTAAEEDVKYGYEKSVIVPLRNAVFLQIAMVYAYTHGFDEVWLGSHLNDCEEVEGERSFPDCSPEFFKAFELAMDFGTLRKQRKIKIKTPSVLGWHKADLIKKSVQIDPEMLFSSWSCYLSGDYQCGVCNSCLNRKNAFIAAGIEDKTEYANRISG
ncbi:MAG: 7-cyano-7-deazaguanine synthase [Prevotellaceae bacterium]|jgi:7-cyano-7-deazaguanine synthase|nr:7-cyano-7-deazaguanine synthase [Prevotellaceae bacterium]